MKKIVMIDSHHRNKMGKMGRKKILQGYHVDKVVKLYIDEIKELVG